MPCLLVTTLICFGNVISELQLFELEDVTFRKDGDPTRYATIFSYFVSETYLEGRIGRREIHREWVPHSPGFFGTVQNLR